MKKNETILKTVFLFLLLIIVYSCRTDNNLTQDQKIKEESIAKQISYQSFLSAFKSKNDIVLSTKINSNKNSKSKNDILENFSIDESKILMVKIKNETTYSMRLVPSIDNDPKNIYNLYVKKDSIGNISQTIIKYSPTIASIKNNYKNINGLAQVIYNDTKPQNKKNRISGEGCWEMYVEVACEFGYVHSQNGPCEWCDGTGSYHFEVTLCSSGGASGGDSPGEITTNDATGSGGSVFISPSTRNALLACEAQDSDEFIYALYSANQNWANQNISLFNNIVNNLCFDSSQQNKQFINWQVNFLSNNSNITKEQFQPMIDFAQKFLSENPDTINPEQIFNRLKLLDDLFKTNPDILLDIPCSQLPYWKDLANHQIPQQVKDKLKTVNSNTHWYNNDLEIQNLDYSKSYTINMDVYPIKISTLPNKPGTNQKFTPAEFFNYFRLNINNFTDVNHGKFYPVVDSNIGVNDTNLWSSSSPLGSLVTIKIPLDEGTVICSGYNSQAWIFTTVKSPWDGEHPVSGNRLFGYYMDGNDMYIYTRGIDRFTSTYSTPEVIRELENLGYSKASDMWKNMQTLLSNFVNSNNGASQVIPGVDYVPNYIFVKEYLKGQRSLNSLGCH
jgi:hypothetical protein